MARARGLSLLVALVFLAAAAPPTALAAVTNTSGLPPGPWNSTVPGMLLLVGHDGSGTPDPAGQFTIVVRDLANNPWPNALVRIDLVVPDVAFCATQQPVFEQVAPDAVQGHTDALGQFTGSLKGAGAGPALQTDPSALAGRIYVEGYLLANVPVAVLDLDGSGGAGVNDLSSWLGDFGTGTPYLRGDYDGNRSLGVNDLSILLARYGAGLSVAGCAP